MPSHPVQLYKKTVGLNVSLSTLNKSMRIKKPRAFPRTPERCLSPIIPSGSMSRVLFMIMSRGDSVVCQDSRGTDECPQPFSPRDTVFVSCVSHIHHCSL